jgi:hypothetical protein
MFVMWRRAERQCLGGEPTLRTRILRACRYLSLAFARLSRVSKLTKWQEWALAMERSLEALRRSRKLLRQPFYPFDQHRQGAAPLTTGHTVAT